MKLNMKRGLVFLLILTLMSSVMPFAFAEDSVEQWIPKNSMSIPRSSLRTEIVNGKIYAIGGKGQAMPSVEEYDPISNEWTTKAPMPNARLYFETVVLDNKIYVLGGEAPSAASYNISADVRMYDPETNTWVLKAPMSVSRSKFKAVLLDGKIYAIGGSSQTGDESPITSSVEKYDPVTNTWESLPSVAAISEFEAVVNDGLIYVMGGKGRVENSLSSVFAFDPINNKWTKKANMPSPRAEFESVLVNEKIYVIGGRINNSRTGLNGICEYDPKTDSWTSKKSMSSGRIGFKTAIINGKIYVVGGSSSTSNSSLSSAEKYDTSTNTWTKIASMNSKRGDLDLEVLGNDMYAIGGNDSSREMSSVEKFTETDNNSSLKPTLTVTASPNKVKVGNRFTTTVAIHNVSNIYAEDIKIDYDAERFEYLGASAKDGLKIYKEDTSTPGSVRFIVAHLGKDSGATGDKDLIELTFKAKSVGIGKVDITKGRIADNDVLEMDVAEENCGEDTIEVEANKDVNRTGEYTLLDLGIDAYYYGMQADQTDTTRFDTDVIPDGVVDDKDLTAITQSILDNSNYPFN